MVLHSGDVVLEAIGSTIDQRSPADVSWTEVIRAITPDHAVLINRQNRRGSMIEAGMSMFILETEPAGYVLIAANEAEKASNITLVDVRRQWVPSDVSPWRDGKVMWRKRPRRRCAPSTTSTATQGCAERSDQLGSAQVQQLTQLWSKSARGLAAAAQAAELSCIQFAVAATGFPSSDLDDFPDHCP